MSDNDCKCWAYRSGRTGNLVDRYVGRRIRERRCDLEIRAEVLATELGIPIYDLASIEEGAVRAGAQVLGRTAKALQVEISYFFDGLELRDAPFELRNADAASAPNVISLKGRKKC